MTRYRPIAIVWIAALIGVLGCSKRSEKYCELHHVDDPVNCPIPDDGRGSDSGAACTTSAQCTMPDLTVCDQASGVCVECTSTDSAACSGATPVCIADTCAKCTTDDQCPTQACLHDGACAGAGSVLYASPAGSSNAACTPSDMCSLTKALSMVTATLKVIKLAPGQYDQSATINLNANVTLTGAGAIINRNGGNTGPTLAISGTHTLTLDYLTIEGGDDSVVGNGITCTGGTVIMHRVHIGPNDASGVESDGCTVQIDRSTISDNAVDGVVINNGTFSLTKSTVTLNSNGGIMLANTSAAFTITNNFIYRNGNSNDATVGGAALPLTIPASSAFAFNTVVDNQVKNTPVVSGGLTCGDVAFDAPNNILVRNSVGGDVSRATANAIPGGCMTTGSINAVNATALKFASSETQPYNYHLTTGSAAVDEAAGGAVNTDVDDEDRPNGPASDVGADELYP